MADDAKKSEDLKKAEDSKKAAAATIAETRKKEEEKKLADDAARQKREAEAKLKVVDDPKPVVVAEAKPTQSASSLLADARGLEAQGQMKAAVKLYKQSVAAGSGEAAKRLSNIYGKGEGGIARDYAESIKWTEEARKRGIDIPKAEKF